MILHLETAQFLTMKSFIVAFLCYFISCESVTGYSKYNENEPLFLTPYIESEAIKEAREDSLVKHPDFEKLNVESYSGYLTVNKKYNSNLFFWYFPAHQANPQDAPLVLYLHGGPGFSSLYALFSEIGSVMVDSKLQLLKRNHTLSLNHNVIYIDNPVGTGFSFTDKDAGYSRDILNISFNLHSALVQFFILFPELKTSDFYMTGESFAGKYIPALGHVIKKYKKQVLEDSKKINLKGMAIGNGLFDPINQIDYGQYLYNVGLLDLNGKRKFEQVEEKVKELIILNQYQEAYEIFSRLLFSNVVSGEPTLLKNLTGFDVHHNFLKPNIAYEEFKSVDEWLQRSDVNSAIHVGNRTFVGYNKLAAEKLNGEFLQSGGHFVEELSHVYKILFFNGQVDIYNLSIFAYG